MNVFNEKVIYPFLKCIYKFKNRRAFFIRDQGYTYKQFSEHISKIRIALQNYSLIEAQVGLVVNDDIETYASIFALWLEGKCYVPLHPDQPINRCLNIVEQVNANLILDSSENSRYSAVPILRTNDLTYTRECLFIKDIRDEELAYILFTSGSTGTPKGVMITRGNLGFFMDSFWGTGININEEDRCLQCFDLTFDVSVQSYLVGLTKGACVYTIPHDQIKYIYVSSLIEDHKLTFGAMAPSMLRFMKPYFNEIDASSLRTCILTAEACPLTLIEDWQKCAYNTDIYDFYGPTEATIYCTYYKVSRKNKNKTLNGIISIGIPMKNVEAIIVDENNQVIPFRKKGKLCVAGEQVTVGYWNNPQKNLDAFFEKEIDGNILKFYNTGDLCYIDNDGNIMYSGRADNQVKIQGYRIELSEIEFHAREFLKDINAVAITFENNSHNSEIALFIETWSFNTDELLKYLRSKMPSYMIPSTFFFADIFPINSNGKIDRNKLKLLIK